MKNVMTTLRRGALLAGGLALTMALAACSGDSPGQPGPATGTTTGDATSSDSRSGTGITNPKNPAALEPCELLPDEAASTLGLKSKGERRQNDLKPDLPDMCTRKGEHNDSKRVTLVAFPDRTIQQYYDNKSSYGYFEKLDISGHPAVIGNTEDPAKSSNCAMYMAANDNQIVLSSTFIPTKDIGQVNPCDLAKQALELSLPSWPAAQ
ncbi:Protein of unknown function [Actinopolyspora xinjiangensis]|uniref:DUF3558 domain-containing protein n=1 Tax=Actinopolyspora xinjiangensis TaxID=405564 RepID=A0A1H0VF53_9ACTN|nr:DUF3558 domain-containing protein [Actinopolyspora xinjiangensis]SDP76835.1 Protein of unknown function [Actinopolyspora xinjiangensis]